VLFFFTLVEKLMVISRTVKKTEEEATAFPHYRNPGCVQHDVLSDEDDTRSPTGAGEGPFFRTCDSLPRMVSYAPQKVSPTKNNMFVSGPECSEPAVGKNTVPYIATMDNLPDFDNFRCGDYGISRGLPSMDDLPDFDNIRCGDYGLSRGLPSSVPPSQMYPFESDAKMSRGHTNC